MSLKRFLPFEKITLTTKLSSEEVHKRLKENIEPKKYFPESVFNRNSAKEYEGEIIGNTFKINQILVGRRNSFAPTISGNISSYLGQTNVNIRMQLLPSVTILMSLWLGIVGLVCLALLFVGLLQVKHILMNGFSPMFLIPFVMFAFGILLTIFGFKSESKKAKEFLTELLEGKETIINEPD